jgi:hypothetical protein
MVLRIFIVYLFSAIQLIAWAQVTDSVAWVRTQPNDTTKVNLLIKFSKSFRETDFTKTVQLGLEAKALSK